MGREHRVGAPEQGIDIGKKLPLEHVPHERARRVAQQRQGQRALRHLRPAARVDKRCMRFHLLEQMSVKHVSQLRLVRQMVADHVALPKQRLHVDKGHVQFFRPLGSDEGVAGQHRHVGQRLQSFGNRLPDSAKAYQPHFAAKQTRRGVGVDQRINRQRTIALCRLKIPLCGKRYLRESVFRHRNGIGDPGAEHPHAAFQERPGKILHRPCGVEHRLQLRQVSGDLLFRQLRHAPGGEGDPALRQKRGVLRKVLSADPPGKLAVRPQPVKDRGSIYLIELQGVAAEQRDLHRASTRFLIFSISFFMAAGMPQ